MGEHRNFRRIKENFKNTVLERYGAINPPLVAPLVESTEMG